MTEAIQALKRQRVQMMLVNLVYFLVLLFLGVLLFLTDAADGMLGYLLAAACLGGYFLLVRPMSKRYVNAVRETVLRYSVCGTLTNFQHQVKEGVSVQTVNASGLTAASADAFLSREHITGNCAAMAVEMADVTFPIVEDGRNAMFNGAFVQISRLGAKFSPVTVKAGELEGLNLPKRQMALLEALGELIPGSLYLKAEGETLTLLLRGRFLSFHVNPLMQISRQTLEANPFPELEQVLQLARLMDGNHNQ